MGPVESWHDTKAPLVLPCACDEHKHREAGFGWVLSASSRGSHNRLRGSRNRCEAAGSCCDHIRSFTIDVVLEVVEVSLFATQRGRAADHIRSFTSRCRGPRRCRGVAICDAAILAADHNRSFTIRCHGPRGCRGVAILCDAAILAADRFRSPAYCVAFPSTWGCWWSCATTEPVWLSRLLVVCDPGGITGCASDEGFHPAEGGDSEGCASPR
jgi:hypothetical protein